MLGMTKGEKEGILPHSLRSLVRMTAGVTRFFATT